MNIIDMYPVSLVDLQVKPLILEKFEDAEIVITTEESYTIPEYLKPLYDKFMKVE